MACYRRKRDHSSRQSTRSANPCPADQGRGFATEYGVTVRILLTADPELPVPPITYGGIERIIADLANGLRSRGHTVGLAAHPDSTTPVDVFFPWPGAASQN